MSSFNEIIYIEYKTKRYKMFFDVFFFLFRNLISKQIGYMVTTCYSGSIWLWLKSFKIWETDGQTYRWTDAYSQMNLACRSNPLGINFAGSCSYVSNTYVNRKKLLYQFMYMKDIMTWLIESVLSSNETPFCFLCKLAYHKLPHRHTFCSITCIYITKRRREQFGMSSAIISAGEHQSAK